MYKTKIIISQNATKHSITTAKIYKRINMSNLSKNKYQNVILQCLGWMDSLELLVCLQPWSLVSQSECATLEPVSSTEWATKLMILQTHTHISIRNCWMYTVQHSKSPHLFCEQILINNWPNDIPILWSLGSLCNDYKNFQNLKTIRLNNAVKVAK